MKLIKFGLAGLICAVLFTSPAFGQTTRKRKTVVAKTNVSSVTDTEISGGLKEALSKGVRFAIDNLGRENGFLAMSASEFRCRKISRRLKKPCGLRVRENWLTILSPR